MSLGGRYISLKAIISGMKSLFYKNVKVFLLNYDAYNIKSKLRLKLLASPIIYSLSNKFFYYYKDQAPVVRKMDSAIHWINYYPLDSAIGCHNTYPLDSDLSGG